MFFGTKHQRQRSTLRSSLQSLKVIVPANKSAASHAETAPALVSVFSKRRYDRRRVLRLASKIIGALVASIAIVLVGVTIAENYQSRHVAEAHLNLGHASGLQEDDGRTSD